MSIRVAKGRGAFDADEDVQIVLVHLIQIIGESITGVSGELASAHPDVPWRQVVAVRNRVVHGHFDVDLDILWDVAVMDVPHLAEQIRAIRDELASSLDG